MVSRSFEWTWAAPGGGAHTRQFVTGFHTPRIMKNVDCRCRVNTLDTKGMGLFLYFTDQYTFVAILRQMPGNVVNRMYYPNIETIGPISFWISGRRMPVIFLLVIDKYRQLARRVNQVTIRCRRQRQPTKIMRIGFERVILVIQKHQPRCAGEYDGVARSGFFERAIVPCFDCVDMRRVKLAELFEINAHGSAS